MSSLLSLSCCKICGFDESVHLRPCTAADIFVAAATTSPTGIAALSSSAASLPSINTTAITPTPATQTNTSATIDTNINNNVPETMADDAKGKPDTETPTSPTVVGKAKSQTYEGQCHCGKVKFSIKLSPPVEDGMVTSCNCSICTANGYLMVYPLEKNVIWHSGFDDLTTYTFGKERIDHSFCSVCGTSVCAMSNDPGYFQDNRAVNVRTLQGVDIEGLKLRKADGRGYVG